MIVRLDDKLWFPDPHYGEDDGLVAVGAIFPSTVCCWPIPTASSHGSRSAIARNPFGTAHCNGL